MHAPPLESLHAETVCAVLLVAAFGLLLAGIAWLARVLDGSRPLLTPPSEPPRNRRRTVSGTYRAGDPRAEQREGA